MKTLVYDDIEEAIEDILAGFTEEEADDISGTDEFSKFVCDLYTIHHGKWALIEVYIHDDEIDCGEYELPCGSAYA